MSTNLGHVVGQRRRQGRRRWLLAASSTAGLALAAGTLGSLGLLGDLPRAWAQPPDDERLRRRLELWSNYARKTESLVARYTSTRSSSLLREPLVNVGVLAYQRPGTLMLTDDAMDGSTTSIRRGRVRITPRQQSEADADLDPREAPALLWLKDRLVACFDGRDPAGLAAGTSAHAPRGRRARIELRPHEASPVRKVVRVVLVDLDPVGGAVTRVQIDEAQGDTYVLALADHRQNVPEAELERLLAPSTG